MASSDDVDAMFRRHAEEDAREAAKAERRAEEKRQADERLQDAKAAAAEQRRKEQEDAAEAKREDLAPKQAWFRTTVKAAFSDAQKSIVRHGRSVEDEVFSVGAMFTVKHGEAEEMNLYIDGRPEVPTVGIRGSQSPARPLSEYDEGSPDVLVSRDVLSGLVLGFYTSTVERQRQEVRRVRA